MSFDREDARFAQALEKPAATRAAFLDGACPGDPALRHCLEALLGAREQSETLLATPSPAQAGCSTIKLDLAHAPDEAVGQTLGHYKLLEKVGEGGCGVERRGFVDWRLAPCRAHGSIFTWHEMDENGVLNWLDRATWQTREAELKKLVE